MGGGSGKPPPWSQTLKRLLLLFLGWQDKGLCNPQGTQSPTSLLVFLCFLSLFQGVLLARMDFHHKGWPCTVSDYKIKLQNKSCSELFAS